MHNQGKEALLEFGVDDYISTKSCYAESIMNCGEIGLAIEKYENVKKSIESEIIYESPLLFVNVCNQLANCYLSNKNTAKALENF